MQLAERGRGSDVDRRGGEAVRVMEEGTDGEATQPKGRAFVA